MVKPAQDSSELITLTRWEKVKVILTAAFGEFANYFDFFAAAYVSAVVWPIIFFSSKTPIIAVLVSIAAYGLSYVARPVGAIVFGHIGDRRGRLSAMIWTLIVLGLGSIGITVLPPYAAIGLAAPALLVLFRLLVGFGLGGEAGGGWTWAAEATADSKYWSFWAGLVQAIGIIGIAIPSFLFGYIELSIPRSAFISWGWRIPFAIGALVVVVGTIIRFKASESPVFKKILSKRRVEKVPVVTMIKEDLRTFLATLIPFTQNTAATGLVLVPFSLLYISKFGIPYALAGKVEGLATAAGGFIGALVASFLTIKFEKKHYLWLVGSLGAFVFLYPMFMLLRTAELMYAALGWGIFYFFNEFMAGSYPSVATSYFSARFRVSAANLAIGLGGAISGILITIFVPMMRQNVFSGLNILLTVYIIIEILVVISLLSIKKKGDITA